MCGKIAIVVAFCTAAAHPAAASAAGPLAGALPSGVYRYAVRADAKTTATSTVTIARGTSLEVTEAAALQGESVNTSRALDPVTFATRSWSGINGDGTTDTVTVTMQGAQYRHARSVTSLDAPARAPAAVFDFFVAEFVTLPAMLAATGATSYAEYCVCIGGFQRKLVSVVPASAPRPPGVPPQDRSVALSADGKTVTLWYDPQTFVLQELDLPQERLSYVRL